MQKCYTYEYREIGILLKTVLMELLKRLGKSSAKSGCGGHIFSCAIKQSMKLHCFRLIFFDYGENFTGAFKMSDDAIIDCNTN